MPALIYVALNAGNGEALRGWAIPTATDIAFALGVLSLLGRRVPASLKVFLTALAIIDDLGAVIIIAIFYTSDLSMLYLGAAFAVLALLFVLNRMGVLNLIPYIALGIVLWVLVLKSGVHATLAGVALALTIPLRVSHGITHDIERSPLHRLEHALHRVVPFLIVPLFGFANAGVSFAGISGSDLVQPLTLGVTAGLVVGKLVGRAWHIGAGYQGWSGRLAAQRALAAHGRRSAALRHRLYHEPVHRPARLCRQSAPSGRGKARHPHGIASCGAARFGCADDDAGGGDDREGVKR